MPLLHMHVINMNTLDTVPDSERSLQSCMNIECIGSPASVSKLGPTQALVQSVELLSESYRVSLYYCNRPGGWKR